MYERDFYQWSLEQAAKLRERKYDQIDWENIIEEIESLGRRDKRELFSRHQSDSPVPVEVEASNGHGWKSLAGLAIHIEMRKQLQAVIADSPSLRRQLFTAVDSEYPDARKDAAETPHKQPETDELTSTDASQDPQMRPAG